MIFVFLLTSHFKIHFQFFIIHIHTINSEASFQKMQHLIFLASSLIKVQFLVLICTWTIQSSWKCHVDQIHWTQYCWNSKPRIQIVTVMRYGTQLFIHSLLFFPVTKQPVRISPLKYLDKNNKRAKYDTTLIFTIIRQTVSVCIFGLGILQTNTESLFIFWNCSIINQKYKFVSLTIV